ncbi:MAG TPA: GGDEF domain-containing protein [Usitatibacter sp.]|nr:GGDEF domain-containing protein [Usitatibacter sp.]
MRILPSRARLAGLGLAFAGATIVALSVFVLLDLDREARVNREVIAAQQVKDALHALRTQVVELRSAARLGARTGERSAYRSIEARSMDVEHEVAALEARAASDPSLAGFGPLADSARMLIVHARSVEQVRGTHGIASADALAERADALSDEATGAIDRSLESQTRRVDERSAAQIELGDRLRRYIAGLLVIAMAVLGMLTVAYRRVQGRERMAVRRMEHMAHYDDVTGLPNRALLTDRLSQETARARRVSESFAVLMFDLDGFKSVNDTWGHAAGDRVLEQVGERVRRCVRASDTVGRLGGDEFLAILPQTSLEGALGVAEKLREALAEPYPLDGATGHLSASVGVSLFPDHGADAEALQRASDAALYRAKREGKNRTLVATAPQPPGTQVKDAA